MDLLDTEVFVSFFSLIVLDCERPLSTSKTIKEKFIHSCTSSKFCITKKNQKQIIYLNKNI